MPTVEAEPRRFGRRAVLIAGAGLLSAFPAFAAGADDGGVSDWVQTGHARVRLIDAGLAGGAGTRLVGVEVQLDPSYLTYWRTPGEAGLPPTMDFSGSTNIAATALSFPAPQRFDEGGAEAFGYQDAVTFPVIAALADPARPASVRLALSFAVCSTLCLPASATLSLPLVGSGAGVEAGLVRDALASVPQPRRLGEGDRLAVESVRPDADGGRFSVVARSPDDAHPTLFVEAPEPWYFQASPATPADAGRTVFIIKAVAGPATPAPVPLSLTLVSGSGAITVQAAVEASAPKP